MHLSLTRDLELYRSDAHVYSTETEIGQMHAQHAAKTRADELLLLPLDAAAQPRPCLRWATIWNSAIPPTPTGPAGAGRYGAAADPRQHRGAS